MHSVDWFKNVLQWMTGGRGEDVYPNNITPASHILFIKNLYTEYKDCNDVFVYPNVLQIDIVIELFFCAIFYKVFVK